MALASNTIMMLYQVAGTLVACSTGCREPIQGGGKVRGARCEVVKCEVPVFFFFSYACHLP